MAVWRAMAIGMLALALACRAADEGVSATDAEKKYFLEVFKRIPVAHESFNEEAVKKAAPFVRVLLAMTEEDVKDSGIDFYGYAMLIVGIAENPLVRDYVKANFNAIRHPQIKQFWAVTLFVRDIQSPEIVSFLVEAVNKEPNDRLGLGPEYDAFLKKLNAAAEKMKK